MTATQLADHLTDDVRQVLAVLHVGQQGGILGLDRLPVHAMHVLEIEAIAEGAPRLIEDLRPFLRIVRRDLHVRRVDGVLQVGLARGDVRDVHLTALEEASLLAA